jgi:hypothetical protein
VRVSSGLKRVLLLLGAVLVIALDTRYRYGHVGPDDFIDAWEDTTPDPAGWVKLDLGAWLRLTEQALTSGNDALAKEYATQALKADLSNGRSAAHLANILAQQGQQSQAEQVATQAGYLAPAHNSTHVYLAAFWQKASNIPQMLNEWNILLIRDPTLNESLFPLLQKFALSAETTHLLDPFAKRAPKWWSAFFSFLLRDKQTPLELLTRFHTLRLQSDQPISDAETTQYVARLITEKRWSEAKAVWVAGLPTELQNLQALVYDGGFEGERHNTGFDWFFTPHPQINIKQELTYGMEGHRALHIHLNNAQHIPFEHVWQRLVLQPARYELDLRVRIDNLRTSKGLQWRLRCENDNRLLAEMETLYANTPWKTLTTPFEIPAETCPVQILRLEASSPYAHDQLFAGDVWFDGIKIHKQTSQP